MDLPLDEKALALQVVHKGKQHLLEEDNTTAKKQQTNNSQSATVNKWKVGPIAWPLIVLKMSLTHSQLWVMKTISRKHQI